MSKQEAFDIYCKRQTRIVARYKPQERHSLLLPVVLSEQLVPGGFACALDYLVDHELDLLAMDAQFKNDEVGASAYGPRVMLKAVLLAYSQGIISSRSIERTCLRNVQFIAISGDSQPSHAHIAKFVSSLGEQIKPLFSQVLMTCDAQGLIGRDMMFAIDGIKLPSNASKERSGTHDELRHRAQRLAERLGAGLPVVKSNPRGSAGIVLLKPLPTKGFGVAFSLVSLRQLNGSIADAARPCLD